MTEQDTPKMTHDEMIDTLKGLVFGTFDRTTAKEREALDMAISALSEPEREKGTEDYDKLMTISQRLAFENEELKEMLSAVPKKGEWIANTCKWGDMKEVTSEFAIAYLLDDCDDCPENENGECLTQSHCFEVKQMAIKALRMMDKSESEDKKGGNMTREYAEWIVYPGGYACSNCRRKSRKSVVVFMKAYPYCPECGCKMRVREKKS